MDNINKLNVGGKDYNVEDTDARRALGSMGGNPSALGADLSQAFATEIAGFPSIWAWIQARIKAANFTGLYVGDYIPFSAAGNNYKAEIAGIDTYYRYGDQEVGHHIDFITRDCHPDTHVWNKVNFNNGLAAEKSPWLCSDLYAWLNSKAMNVPNAASADPATVAVDYTASGVLNTLPSTLAAVIVEKRALVPIRHTAGQLLIDDNSWEWKNVGKLWLPYEVEVYGCGMWGTINPANPGYSTGGFVQYPIFANNMRRIKGVGDGGARSSWWLASVRGGYSTYCAHVTSRGNADNASATDTAIRAPLCFRIA